MTDVIAQIGPPMQLAFVPDDFDAALAHWTEAMGAGPFFLMENIALEDMRFKGEPSDAVFSLALGYWGDMQIELIRPKNDAPSIYRGEYVPAGGGLHHICLLTDDIANAQSVCDTAGAETLVTAKVGEDGGVIYADCGRAASRPNAGAIVEILQPATGTLDVFAMMRDAARGWDGSDPVRSLG